MWRLATATPPAHCLTERAAPSAPAEVAARLGLIDRASDDLQVAAVRQLRGRFAQSTDVGDELGHGDRGDRPVHRDDHRPRAGEGTALDPVDAVVGLSLLRRVGFANSSAALRGVELGRFGVPVVSREG